MALNKAGMLCFATHGLISGDQADDGATAKIDFAFTPGDAEGGFQTACAMAGLQLHAGPVALAACLDLRQAFSTRRRRAFWSAIRRSRADLSTP